MWMRSTIIINHQIIIKIKPHQIYAAGDLADPHGTHSVCIKLLFQSLNKLKREKFMNNCWVWLYRGAWHEWEINEIDMAVPLSPQQVLKKRKSILGSYFEPKNEEERMLLPELNKLKPLPEPKE